MLDAVYEVVNWTLSQPQGNLHARGKYKPTKGNCPILEAGIGVKRECYGNMNSIQSSLHGSKRASQEKRP